MVHEEEVERRKVSEGSERRAEEKKGGNGQVAAEVDRRVVWTYSCAISCSSAYSSTTRCISFLNIFLHNQFHKNAIVESHHYSPPFTINANDTGCVCVFVSNTSQKTIHVIEDVDIEDSTASKHCHSGQRTTTIHTHAGAHDQQRTMA